MRGSRLAQAVYGKCSLVLPSRCNLYIVCLTLVRTIAVVALTRPPCRRLPRSPSLRIRSLTRTSRARDGFKDAEVPSKRRDSPLGLLSCGCLENGVAIHMGIMRSHYDRSFLPIPPAGSFAYAFADHRQPANPSIGPVLFHQRVELLPREVLQQLMKNAIVCRMALTPRSCPDRSPTIPAQWDQWRALCTAKMYRSAVRRCRALW